MMFVREDTMSFQLLLDKFDRFSEATGLIAKKKKSLKFIWSTDENTKKEILIVTGF